MKQQSYNTSGYMQQYESFLPDVMKFKDGRLPKEEWWQWRGNQVHIDRMEHLDAKLKVILVHGGAGNGRVWSGLGNLVYSQGYDYIAPDLPGFGLTKTNKEYNHEWANWINLVSDLIDQETKKDGKPVVLFGGSIGGMLAYQVACKNSKVKGLIATTLADIRTIEVRDAFAKNKLWSRLGVVFMRHFGFIMKRINIRAKWIAKFDQVTNDLTFSKVFKKDKYIGNALINMHFYKTMIEYDSHFEPENFTHCPLLLAHPGKDLWTPTHFSKPFFDRIGGKKKFVVLENAGHLPYEEPGVYQLKEAIKEFIASL